MEQTHGRVVVCRVAAEARAQLSAVGAPTRSDVAAGARVRSQARARANAQWSLLLARSRHGVRRRLRVVRAPPRLRAGARRSVQARARLRPCGRVFRPTAKALSKAPARSGVAPAHPLDDCAPRPSDMARAPARRRTRRA